MSVFVSKMIFFDAILHGFDGLLIAFRKRLKVFRVVQKGEQ